MGLKEAYIITFIASFCTLVIEIVAGRILAPFLGVSIYTWTSIIGVILAGISLGAYAGGKIGDRFPNKRTLGWLLFASGIVTYSVSPLTNLIAAYQFHLPLVMRIFMVTVAIFFIPGFILGMVSPVVVKLALKQLENSGVVVGKIYAMSTLGAIIGTFLTGFIFISWIGSRSTLIATGTMLLFAASYSLFKKRSSAAIFLAVTMASAVLIHQFLRVVPSDGDFYFSKESSYYTIRLSKYTSADKKTTLEKLSLDNLAHSYVSLQNPLHLEYEYERIFVETLTWKFQRGDSFRTLMIGGGGYTLPRGMEIYFPNASIDVVEIDPEVTKTAHKYLGLPANTRIRTFNTDGRWYVMNCDEKYDIIIVDAYNDVSVPYHLTTKEFTGQLKKIMKPGGLLAGNIVDHLHKGLFLPSYIKTLGEVFGKDNVGLIAPRPDLGSIEISTFIVVASNGSLNLGDMEEYLKATRKGFAQSVVVPGDFTARLLNNQKAIILTDDYSPVDNLIAPVFEQRYAYKLGQKQQREQQK